MLQQSYYIIRQCLFDVTTCHKLKYSFFYIVLPWPNFNKTQKFISLLFWFWFFNLYWCPFKHKSDTFQFSSLKSAEIIFFNYSLTKCYIFMSFNNCDHMYLKSLCYSCKCKAVCKSYIRFFLTLNVIISMFIIYSNKCICTSVPPPPPPKLVFRISGWSRQDDILQALEVRLNGSHC